MTQLVFDLDHLDRFFERFGGPSPIPVLVGICPIWITGSRCGCTTSSPASSFPSRSKRHGGRPGSDAARVGIAYAKELYGAARDKAAGLYLVAPYRKPLDILTLIS